ncbi:ATP-binding cassette domain-containing protein, partial [Salmonella enterica subsp. enterica serovar Kottbus]|nr:ATP-binding cassette domain-containing protein [Salmonella enterica subsp. enterica serovar Kottbus]
MTNAIAERLSLPRSTADEALGISGITFDYGKRRALADLSFSIRSGETVILLGPNGAGKSTLFSLIS